MGMAEQLQCFIGFDRREAIAFDVAAATLRQEAGLVAAPLMADRLRDRGLLWRPEDTRGQRFDLVSQAPASTDFAISRFLVPILCQAGWALFTDSDVVFLDDVRQALRPHLNEDFAVLVVPHVWQPTAAMKMDGQLQQRYARKNWSSVMVFNCEHPANRRLTLHDVNTRPGLWLHQFGWLHDSEIGRLPPRFNWLVNEQPRPPATVVAHFTNGGPFLPEWPGAPEDDVWIKAAGVAGVDLGPVCGTYEPSISGTVRGLSTEGGAR